MVITNFSPPSRQRLTGSLYAWSATWKNSERTATATNTLLFHVLMLQPYLNSTFQSVINELGLHAPRLVISDRLAAQKSMVLETRDLEVTGELIPPASAGWSNTNVVDVLNLTNRGTITVAGSAVVG